MEHVDFSQLISDFDFIEDWEDRYRYLIELGRNLTPLPPQDHRNDTKVQGCSAQVWLVSQCDAEGRLHFSGDSDAAIVKGLMAVLFSLLSGKKPSQILALDAGTALEGLGLKDHLTQQRSNGLAAMVMRMKHDARTLIEEHG